MQDLTPEQWSAVDRLFDEALDRPESERSAYLRAHCGNDPVLYERVVRLLRSEAEARQALGDSATDFANAMLQSMSSEELAREEEATPDVVGSYRIVRQIGRGGMGTVYLAERADGTFEKSVALKLVKRGMDTDEVLRRFRYERQILAGLDHPNIARLLDAGAAGDGRPYFVMEYCDGETITNYAEAEGLNVEQRLRLFEQVCDAVAYAHRHLVVHRDLKPGNILVADGDDGKPSVKLLDFGIAQLVEDRPDAPVTRLGDRILTPEYAAPEQFKGEVVTTSADVFALGVVLHELLVGSRPEKPLKRPSTVVTRSGQAPRGTSIEKLRRELKTDLDAIVITALQEDPQLRYISADALREDLRRRREGLPLVARKSTIRYRASKFVKRHTWGVAAAAVALVALVGFLFALDQQRRQTIAERDTAQATATFLQDLFDAADPFSIDTQRPDTLRAADLLDRGVVRARRTLADRPLLQANTLQTVGRVYSGLSMYARADSLLTEVVATRRSLAPSDREKLSESLHELGAVRSYMGRYDSADSLLGEAMTIRRGLFGEASAPYVQSLVERASVQRKKGEYDAAELSIANALDLQRKLFGEESLDVASSLMILGRMLTDHGRPAEGEPVYREALAIRKKLLPENHPTIAETLDNLGVALQEQRKLDEAEAMVREALAIRIETLGEWHSAVADTRHNLAVVLSSMGRFDESIALYDQVRQANVRNLGPDHPYVGYTLLNMGIAESRMGNNEKALDLYQQAYDVLIKTLPRTHGAVLETLGGRGYQYVRLGQPAKGEPLLRETFELRMQVDGPDSWRTGVAESTLGNALMDMGRNREAEKHLVEGLRRIQSANGPDRAAIQRLVAFYEKQGDDAKADVYRAMLPE